jgi:1,4-dihydroxy-6-naphthoate synthase
LLDAINIEEVLTKAVKVGNTHKELLSKMLIERNLVRVDSETLKKYLSLYANDESITLSEIQLKAINKLFELGFNAGFYPELIDVNECLIPKEYKKVRNS